MSLFTSLNQVEGTICLHSFSGVSCYFIVIILLAIGLNHSSTSSWKKPRSYSRGDCGRLSRIRRTCYIYINNVNKPCIVATKTINDGWFWRSHCRFVAKSQALQCSRDKGSSAFGGCGTSCIAYRRSVVERTAQVWNLK